MLFANPSAATLQNSGKVTVNAKTVGPTSTIFAGDRLQTAVKSTSTITTDGTMAVVGPNSLVIFGTNVLDLGCGELNLSTTSGESVRVSGLDVSPAAGSQAKFVVVADQKEVKVVSTSDSISVNDGVKTTTLQQGESLSRPSGGGCLRIPAAGATPDWTGYVAGTGAAAVSGVIAYCSVGGWCNKTTPSPSIP